MPRKGAKRLRVNHHPSPTRIRSEENVAKVNFSKQITLCNVHSNAAADAMSRDTCSEDTIQDMGIRLRWENIYNINRQPNKSRSNPPSCAGSIYSWISQIIITSNPFDYFQSIPWEEQIVESTFSSLYCSCFKVWRMLRSYPKI